jgi:hypothetical protein
LNSAAGGADALGALHLKGFVMPQLSATPQVPAAGSAKP